MRVLIDTHILIWSLTGDERLPGRARATIEDKANEILFSAVSILEVAIKWQLRRADFRHHPTTIRDGAIESGFLELPVDGTAASRVADLPRRHLDPFDRLLIAQAMAETIRLYTHDAALAPYSELVTLTVD